MSRIRPMIRRLRSRFLEILTEESSPGRLALAFAAGAFVGPTPTIGLHTVSAIALAWLLGLNRVVAVVGSNIANPWTMAFFLYLDVKAGAWLLGRSLPPFPQDASLDEVWVWLEPRILPAFVGCVPVGLVTAALAGVAMYVVARVWAARGGAPGEPGGPGRSPRADA